MVLYQHIKGEKEPTILALWYLCLSDLSVSGWRGVELNHG